MNYFELVAMGVAVIRGINPPGLGYHKHYYGSDYAFAVVKNQHNWEVGA